MMVELWAHNPTFVKLAGGSSWSMKTFSYAWRFDANPYNIQRFDFSYAEPIMVEAAFPIDLGFLIKREFKVPIWTTFITLGINDLLWNTPVENYFNKDHISIRVQCKAAAFKLREKLVIEISEDQAVRFLQREVELTALAARLAEKGGSPAPGSAQEELMNTGKRGHSTEVAFALLTQLPRI